jgi:glycogen(starch) synthase
VPSAGAALVSGPRRVLMTADAVGGVWEYALELCRGLGQHGVSVVLAVLGPPPEDHQRAAAARIPGLELVTAPFKLEWMDEPWSDVAASGAWLLELEQRHACDLVHLNGYAHGGRPFSAPKLVVGHSCVLSWWDAVKGGEAPALWDRYRWEVAAGLGAADRVVAPSAWMLSRLRLHYGELPEAEVIPNGRREQDYAPGAKESFVLGAGRIWDPGKNLDLLARAAERLPWPVYIAGPAGPEGASSIEAADNVHFLGRLPADRLAAVYARCPVYVSTARYEPFGLTVLEAALSGCALVLADLPSFRELWKDAALFVPRDDEEALAATLRGLIDEPGWLAALANQARRRAREYGSERMVQRYLTTYRQLLARRAGLAHQEVSASCAS